MEGSTAEGFASSDWRLKSLQNVDLKQFAKALIQAQMELSQQVLQRAGKPLSVPGTEGAFWKKNKATDRSEVGGALRRAV